MPAVTLTGTIWARPLTAAPMVIIIPPWVLAVVSMSISLMGMSLAGWIIPPLPTMAAMTRDGISARVGGATHRASHCCALSDSAVECPARPTAQTQNEGV